MNDTIAAVAASGGPIGIIRVSGAQAIGAVSAVFSPELIIRLRLENKTSLSVWV